MAQGGQLTTKEKKEIRAERKKLRKELREKGITKRRAFEEVAQMLGHVYGEDKPRLLWKWWHFQDWYKELTLKNHLIIIGVILAIVFPLAVIANQKGSLLVTMTTTQMLKGLTFYETEDRETDKTRLMSGLLKEVNAFTVTDIPENVNEQEGTHNLDDLVAYTFWAVNEGEAPLEYSWYIVMTNSTKDIENATWLMIFDEEGMLIYAMKNEEGQERVPTWYRPCFLTDSADPDNQFIPEDESYRFFSVIPRDWLSHKLVTYKTDQVLEPGEAQKYTVAIWVEGYDLDCDADIIGGHTGFRMFFTAGEGDNKRVEQYIEEDFRFGEE